MSPPSPLIELIAEQVAEAPVPAGARALSDALIAQFGDAAQAILYYGSCFRSENALDGLVDLYVLTQSYRATYPAAALRLGNKLLPPNVFYLELPFDGRTLRTKYAVVSLADFEAGTGRWFHSYIWGRFAQPAGLVYARNDAVRTRVHSALATAVLRFSSRVLPRLAAEFDAADLWQVGLSLTYRAELRAERPDRVVELYQANREHYERITEAAMTAMPYDITAKAVAGRTRYQVYIPLGTRRLSRVVWALRRLLGKLLSVLRLAKAVFTFRGGVDYIVWKLERHTGAKIDLTPQQRRHPLILGWGLMWRLYRRGVFR